MADQAKRTRITKRRRNRMGGTATDAVARGEVPLYSVKVSQERGDTLADIAAEPFAGSVPMAPAVSPASSTTGVRTAR